MHYADIKRVDVANGPGVRVSLFVSGCHHHCPGCFNPETWDFSFGRPFDAQAEQTLLAHLRPGHIRGLSLLGGEPLAPENQRAVLALVLRVRRELPDKTIWCYTGYQFEDLLAGQVGDGDTVRTLLAEMDVLVDGPFVEGRKSLGLRFRGSDNQRLLDLPKSLAAQTPILWDGLV